MRRDVFMWHSGRYPNHSSFSRLRAIIGLRTSESQHLPTKHETDFRYRQRPGGDSCNWRERDRKRDDKRSNHRARWRFPTGSSGKRYLRDQLYRLYDAKYPDKRENDLQHHPRRRYAEIGWGSRTRLWSGATQTRSLRFRGRAEQHGRLGGPSGYLYRKYVARAVSGCYRTSERWRPDGYTLDRDSWTGLTEWR